MKQVLTFVIILLVAFTLFGWFKRHSRAVNASLIESGFTLTVANALSCDFGEHEAIEIDEARGLGGDLILSVESLGNNPGKPFFSKTVSAAELKSGFTTNVKPIVGLFEPIGFFICRDSGHEGSCRNKESFTLTDFVVKNAKGPKTATKKLADHVYFFQPLRIDGNTVKYLGADGEVEAFYRGDRTLTETLESARKVTANVKSLPLKVGQNEVTISLAGRDPVRCPVLEKWSATNAAQKK